MTTPEIASRLVDYCRKGEFEQAQKELYADNIVSIEPFVTPDFEKETKGLEAVLEKGRKFSSMIGELHGIEVSDPLVTDTGIALRLVMDITMKGKDRGKFDELCIYKIDNGKIVSEEFIM